MVRAHLEGELLLVSRLLELVVRQERLHRVRGRVRARARARARVRARAWGERLRG